MNPSGFFIRIAAIDTAFPENASETVTAPFFARHNGGTSRCGSIPPSVEPPDPSGHNRIHPAAKPRCPREPAKSPTPQSRH